MNDRILMTKEKEMVAPQEDRLNNDEGPSPPPEMEDPPKSDNVGQSPPPSAPH